jgi:UTP-glucose-1-phosphate uridylyltransferase
MNKSKIEKWSKILLVLKSEKEVILQYFTSTDNLENVLTTTDLKKYERGVEIVVYNDDKENKYLSKKYRDKYIKN